MRVFAALLALLLSADMALAECRPDRVDLRGDFGTASFRVEVADDPQERAVGLMHRPSMPSGAGMIFIYEQPQRVSFWMENTLIPLDMIFMDQTGMVTRVHENAIPLDRTPIPGGPDVLAVLEINGGLSSRIGIREGAELRHPGLPQDLAAWPCAAE
ncbi:MULTISPECIES: DUF192 domain-containing protein [Paracoccaceae]|jgi:uncharacterized membrane protein (UPF0127 family)|uniref:DUF192 domain-containing protein n=1 Tax=Rhodobacterales TaxID=204455 RepID=UPI001D0B1733|nr:DUF192 domain-containing protein [Boseongicola sp. H5]